MKVGDLIQVEKITGGVKSYEIGLIVKTQQGPETGQLWLKIMWPVGEDGWEGQSWLCSDDVEAYDENR